MKKTQTIGLLTLFLLSFLLARSGAVRAADPAVEQPGAEQPSVEKLLDRMAQTFGDLETAAVVGSYSQHLVLPDQEPGDQKPEDQNLPVTILYRSGPEVKVTLPGQSLYTDGQDLTIYYTERNEYSVVPYQPALWAQLVPFAARVPGFGAPLPPEQEQVDYAAAYRELVEEPTVQARETVGEYACWRVEGRTRARVAEEETVQVPVQVWHRQEDAVPVKVTVDLAPAVRRSAQLQPQRQAQIIPDELQHSFTAEKRQINRPIPAGQMALSVPDDATEMGGIEEFDLSGQQAPEFAAQTLTGRTVRMSDLRGKVVILDFWASWCGPCMQELPHIQELWEQVQDQDVIILGVNRDRGIREAQTAVENLGLTFPNVPDQDGNIATKYNVRAIPNLVVVDPQGVVMGRFVGYSPGIAGKLRRIIRNAGVGEQTGASAGDADTSGGDAPQPK